MDQKNIIIVGAITILLMLVFIIVENNKNNSMTGELEGQLIFANLESDINKTHSVEVRQGDKKVTVKKNDGQWQVEQRDNYAADFSKIKQLLFALANFRIVEKKTRRPELYTKLGVEDIDADNAKSTSITIKDEAGSALVDVIIGNKRTATGGASKAGLYVRKAGDAQSWLVEGSMLALEIKIANPASWLQRDLIDIDQEQVKSVLIKQPDGSKLQIEKDDRDAQDYVLLDIPKGKTIKSNKVVNDVALILNDLQLEDLVTTEEINFDKAMIYKIKVITYDGTQVDISSTKKGDDWYARFKLTQSAVAKPDEEPKKQADIKALSSKLAERVFKLPSYKAANFSTTIDELLK